MFGRTYIDDAVFVAYTDTIGDLAAGGVGALVAGLVLARTHGVVPAAQLALAGRRG